MNNEATTVTGKAFDEATVKYIVQLFKDGKDAPFIVSNLVDNGYDYDTSYAYVTTIHEKIATAQVTHEKKNAPWNLIFGLIILTIGIVVTTSGAGVIAYGAIIVGALKTLQGLANVLS